MQSTADTHRWPSEREAVAQWEAMNEFGPPGLTGKDWAEAQKLNTVFVYGDCLMMITASHNGYRILCGMFTMLERTWLVDDHHWRGWPVDFDKMSDETCKIVYVHGKEKGT